LRLKQHILLVFTARVDHCLLPFKVLLQLSSAGSEENNEMTCQYVLSASRHSCFNLLWTRS